MRKGLGKGLGMGYKNIAPFDSHIHSLSAKGVKSKVDTPKNLPKRNYAHPTMTETEKAIASMLTENTGAHLLDSGGAYGRNYERNQGVDFKKQKAVTWDEYGVYRNVFPYLTEYLSVTAKSKKYQKMYDKKYAKSEENYIADMENFAEYLKEKGISKADDYLVGDKMNIVNTYNGENLLTQVLQYGMFYDGDDYFVVLQIHGGADVRGGYTAPKIFQLSDDADSFILNQTNVNVETKKGRYYTDDTYNFYDENDSRDSKTWEDLYKEGIVGAF